MSAIQIIAVALRVWIIAGLQRHPLAGSEYFLIVALVVSLIGVGGNTWLLEQSTTGPLDLGAVTRNLRARSPISNRIIAVG